LRNNDTFTDRLEAQAKARQALLEKAKQNDPTNDPEFAARQQARLEAARQREEREAEQRRAEEAKRLAVERQAAAEAAAKEALRLSRKIKPAALGLADLKAALEGRGK
jgi:membrane protein involved in colicin uptake